MIFVCTVVSSIKKKNSAHLFDLGIVKFITDLTVITDGRRFVVSNFRKKKNSFSQKRIVHLPQKVHRREMQFIYVIFHCKKNKQKMRSERMFE